MQIIPRGHDTVSSPLDGLVWFTLLSVLLLSWRWVPAPIHAEPKPQVAVRYAVPPIQVAPNLENRDEGGQRDLPVRDEPVPVPVTRSTEEQPETPSEPKLLLSKPTVAKPLDLRWQLPEQGGAARAPRQCLRGSDNGSTTDMFDREPGPLATRPSVRQSAREPYVNSMGELERRVSDDCVLQQRVHRLAVGNDELVTFLAFCREERDTRLSDYFEKMAERRNREHPAPRAGSE